MGLGDLLRAIFFRSWKKRCASPDPQPALHQRLSQSSLTSKLSYYAEVSSSQLNPLQRSLYWEVYAESILTAWTWVLGVQ